MKDKVTLITGANSGIGLETAKRFLMAGSKVVINYKDNEKNISNLLESLNKENKEKQGEVIAIKKPFNA